jgi:GPH family glycoside/pentoside/hexuronide:cation symporter
MVAIAEGSPSSPKGRRAVSVGRPSLTHKLAYSVGQFAQSGAFDAALGYIFFYYTAVLGLPGALVGVALAVSLAFDAVVDPVVGSWSDAIRSPLGRRLPIMLLSAPFMALALGALFAPPAHLSQNALFVWLTVSCVAARSFISLFNVPYFALGAELAEDYTERSNVVALRAVAGIVAGVAVTVIAFGLFFIGPQGLQRASGYPGFGWTVGVITALTAIVCVFGLRHYAAALPSPTSRPAPMWKRLPLELAEIFRNPSFRLLFISAVVFYVAVGLNATLGSHAAVFVWKLPAILIQTLGYAYLVGILIGIGFTPLVASRLEKKTLVLIGLCVVVAIWTVLPGLRGLGIIHFTGAATAIPLVANSFIAGLGVGLVAVAYPSMMADAADEHELLMGSRREGLYFAGLGFAGKAASGLGVLVAGFALDLVGFPKDVAHLAPGALSSGALSRLMLVHGPGAAVIAVLAMVIFAPYSISRTRQAQISHELGLKRAEIMNIPDGVAPGA